METLRLSSGFTFQIPKLPSNSVETITSGPFLPVISFQRGFLLLVMRIIKKGIAHRNGEGFVRLQADEPEDMYHLFNLICEGDIVRADTVRNVSVSKHNDCLSCSETFCSVEALYA